MARELPLKEKVCCNFARDSSFPSGDACVDGNTLFEERNSLMEGVTTSSVNLPKAKIVGAEGETRLVSLSNWTWKHHLSMCQLSCLTVVFCFLAFWTSKHLCCFITLIFFLSLVFLPSSYQSIAASCSPGQLVHSCCSQPGMWDRDRRDSSSLFWWTWNQKAPDRRVQCSSPSPNWSHHVYSATRTGNQWMKNRWKELEGCRLGMGWQEP